MSELRYIADIRNLYATSVRDRTLTDPWGDPSGTVIAQFGTCEAAIRLCETLNEAEATVARLREMEAMLIELSDTVLAFGIGQANAETLQVATRKAVVFLYGPPKPEPESTP